MPQPTCETRVRLGVAPRGEVPAHQLGVEAVAADLAHVVASIAEPDRVAEVALEGEVDVARREHERAVHARRGRKREAQPAGPVRDRARLRGVAPDAADARALELHVERGAGVGGHAHRFRRRAACRMPSRTFSSSAGVGRQRSRISGCSFETISTRAPPFRMSGSSAACRSPSTVRSATKRRLRERADHGPEALRARRSRRSSAPAPAPTAAGSGRRRGRPARRAGQRELGELDVHRARLRLRQDRRRVARASRRSGRTPRRSSRSTSLRCARAAWPGGMVAELSDWPGTCLKALGNSPVAARRQ